MKPINLKPLTKRNCELVIFEYLKRYLNEKYSSKLEHSGSKFKILKNITPEAIKLETSKVIVKEDNLEGLIEEGYQHEVKDNVARFTVSYVNPISLEKHNLDILAKTSKPYKEDRKENIRNESEALKLCNEIYSLGRRNSKQTILSKNKLNDEYIRESVDVGGNHPFIPQYYAYDSELSVLFRGYLEGESLTKIMLKAKNLYNNEKNREIKKNIKRNIDLLLRAVVESLGEIHEKTSNYKNFEKFNIKKPDAYTHAWDFSNLVMELSDEMGIKNSRDVYYKEEIINNFLSSPLGEYLNSSKQENSKFILGDYFSDNILIENNLDEDSLGAFKFDMKDILGNSRFSDKHICESWKNRIRIIDFGKSQFGPVQLDLNDLLNEPYPGFRKLKNIENYTTDYSKDRVLAKRIKEYTNFVNSFRGKDDKNDPINNYNFKKIYNYCSITRLMKQRVNERYDQFKPGFVKRLNDVLTRYEGFEDLKNTLERRDLINTSRHKKLIKKL